MNSALKILYGFLFFITGCLIYIMVRPEAPYLLFSAQTEIFMNLPGFIKYSSPAFFHCTAMILISAPFISNKKYSVYKLAFFWVLIEIIFETGQKYSSFIESILNDHYFFYMINYFNKGTFDPADIGMSVAGGIVGIIILNLLHANKFDFKDLQKGKKHVS
jgi:hypothetical protein